MCRVDTAPYSRSGSAVRLGLPGLLRHAVRGQCSRRGSAGQLGQAERLERVARAHYSRRGSVGRQVLAVQLQLVARGRCLRSGLAGRRLLAQRHRLLPLHRLPTAEGAAAAVDRTRSASIRVCGMRLQSWPRRRGRSTQKSHRATTGAGQRTSPAMSLARTQARVLNRSQLSEVGPLRLRAIAPTTMTRC